MKYMIDTMECEQWEQVRSIHYEGPITGNATFESAVPDWEKWDSTHLPGHRLVARENDRILAWAALTPVSSRMVYSGVAEISLYVGVERRGKGVGSALLEAVIRSSEKAGLWTLQGTIFPENSTSLHLVEKHGFKKIGRREKILKSIIFMVV